MTDDPRPRTASESDGPGVDAGRESGGAATDRRRPDGGDRAQAHTLEGIVASLVVLTAVVFALQMTAVTPLSASTSSQHLENQQQSTARGILATADERDALERAVLAWNESASGFHNATDFGYHASDPPPNDFGAMLDRTFTSRGIAFNVRVTYRTTDDRSQSRYLIYQGRPSDNAVSAARTLTLFDDDPLYDHESNPRPVTVSETSEFYAPDASDSSVYNVLRVEVVVWRI